MKRYALLLGLFLLPVSAVQASFDVDNPPMGVFSDEWYAVMFKGQKSGHMHSRMERKKGETGEVIVSTITMRLEVGRSGTPVVVSLKQSSTETLKGEPLAFSNVLKLGNVPTTSRGTVKDGQVNIMTTQFGRSTTQTYTLPKGATMNWGSMIAQAKNGIETGTSYEVGLYEPSMAPDRLIPVKVEMLKRETIDLFGRKVEAVKSRQLMTVQGMLGGAGEMETFVWLTDKTTAARMEMTFVNFPIEVIACSKAVALAANDPAELMLDTLITIDTPINAERARSITYRIRQKNGKEQSALEPFPETAIQKVDRKSKKEVVVTITRLSSQKPPTLAGTLSEQDRELYLASTSMVDHKDPEVAKLLKQADGEEKDFRKLAERLCRFVGQYVRSKNLNVGFATASEVARSREGDCTEHGILLAALGRGAGIPTRLVTGVVYTDDFENRRNVFVGHLWTQFWLDGQWVDLDPALRQTDVDPTHIAFGISAAGDTGVADMTSSFWLAMGNLEITVLEADPPNAAPAASRPDQ